MKYMITESQYKLLFEDRKVEFPGISFFGGDLEMIESLLDDFVIDGEPIDSLKDIFIHEIKLKLEQEDSWIDVSVSNLIFGSWHLSSLRPEGVDMIQYVEKDDKGDDEWFDTIDEEYQIKPYKEFSVDELYEIYNFISE